ncbi:MAG TPA: OmpH family outer membrane protein [Verrucomicrobiae bacterium]|nr:OmpH family outer membrane protein [Verrucomicrobiae bacterium]
MRNGFKRILPVLLVLAFSGATALAQTKIATVNMQKVFEGYYKTKLATAAIQKRKAELDKDDKDYKDQFKTANDEYQKLMAAASDPALSSEERDKRKQAADAKWKQLQESRATIDQFERQAQATLAEQVQQMQQKVLVDIQAAVASKAKAGGYSLVLDSAKGANGLGAVLYTSGQDDLTDGVLSQLNVGAPIDISSPGVLPATPSLLNTNQP